MALKLSFNAALTMIIYQIKEGDTMTNFFFMPTLGDVFELCGIEPSNRGGHRAEVDLIGRSMCITSLAFLIQIPCLIYLKPDSIFNLVPLILDDLPNK